jgi:CheY-like chemotaxis protein
MDARHEFKVLLVEDNPGDVRLTREAFREGGSHGTTIEVAKDGVEAMARLRRSGLDADRPDLVLLDLNLPRKDGREVLREVKSDPALTGIPVVVLSTSSAAADVARCYDLHANAYVTKPSDFDEFMTVIRRIEAFWTTAVTRAPAGRAAAGGEPSRN